MNSEQRELLRIAILRVLDANGTRKFGLNIGAIKMFLIPFGFHVEPKDIEREVDYLLGEPHKFVESVNKEQFSPENQAWKISTRGMNFLAERGF